MLEISVEEELDSFLKGIENGEEEGVAFVPFHIGSVGGLKADIMLTYAEKTAKGFKKVETEPGVEPQLLVKVSRSDEIYDGPVDKKAEEMQGWYVVSKATETKATADTGWIVGTLTANKVQEDGTLAKKNTQIQLTFGDKEEEIFKSVKSALKFISTKTKQNVGGKNMKKVKVEEKDIVIDGVRLVDLSNDALTDKVNDIMKASTAEMTAAQKEIARLTTTGNIIDQNGKSVKAEVVVGKNAYDRLLKQFENKYKDVNLASLASNKEALAEMQEIDKAKAAYEKNEQLLAETKTKYQKAEQKMVLASAIVELRRLNAENEGRQKQLDKAKSNDETAKYKALIKANNAKIKDYRALISEAADKFPEFVSVKEEEVAPVQPVQPVPGLQNIAPVEDEPVVQPQQQQNPVVTNPVVTNPAPAAAEEEKDGLVVIDRDWVRAQDRKAWEEEKRDCQKQSKAKLDENKKLAEEKATKQKQIEAIKKEIADGQKYLAPDVVVKNPNFDGSKDRTAEIEKLQGKIKKIDELTAANKEADRAFRAEMKVADAAVKLIDLVSEVDQRKLQLDYIDQISKMTGKTDMQKSEIENILYKLTGTNDGSADEGKFAEYADVIRRDLKEKQLAKLPLPGEERRKAAAKASENESLAREAEAEAAAEINKLRTAAMDEAYKKYYVDMRQINSDAEYTKEQRTAVRALTTANLDKQLALLFIQYGYPTKEDAKANREIFKQIEQEDKKLEKENKATDKGRTK